MKKSIIYKLIQDPELSSEYSSYLTSVDDDTEYLLAQAEFDLKKAMQMDLTDQQSLDDVRDTISWLFDSVGVYDAYNYANIDSVTFAEGSYFDSLLYRLEQISALMEVQQDIVSDRIIELNADLSGIEEDLESITPRADFDQSYIDIYTLFIKKIIEVDLDPADYILLNSIAQDFADSSLANVTAYTMFNLCSVDPYPDYSYKCDEEEPFTSAPSNDNYDISNLGPYIDFGDDNLLLSVTLISDGQLLLYDITGKQIAKALVRKEDHRIQLGMNLVPGLYYYVILDTDVHNLVSSGIFPILER